MTALESSADVECAMLFVVASLNECSPVRDSFVAVGGSPCVAEVSSDADADDEYVRSLGAVPDVACEPVDLPAVEDATPASSGVRGDVELASSTVSNLFAEHPIKQVTTSSE